MKYWCAWLLPTPTRVRELCARPGLTLPTPALLEAPTATSSGWMRVGKGHRFKEVVDANTDVMFVSSGM